MDEHVVRLRYGRAYRVRCARPTDEAALIRMLEAQTPEENRLRFFSHLRQFPHHLVARLLYADGDRHLALVAFAQDEADLAGTAMLVMEPGGEAGEFAVQVHHDHAELGLGGYLLRRLLEQANALRVRKVYGIVLRENAMMLQLAGELGFVVRADPEDRGCVRVEIELAPRALAAAAVA